MPTNTKQLLVSIGIPVFNGENYLEKCLLSVLEQTHKNLEVIISDNASDDRTADICQDFAGSDGRIKYFRQERNLGAGPNYNLVFESAQGRYFKWAAHDDTIDPGTIEKCLEILEDDPQCVLCHPRLVDVDHHGTVIEEESRDYSDKPVHLRLKRSIAMGHNCAEIFGVIRSEMLRQTGLIRSYSDSDRTLICELALRGTIRQTDEATFYRRVHSGKSDRVYNSYRERTAWFDPQLKGAVVLPAWSQIRDVFGAIWRTPMSGHERLLCSVEIARQMKWRRHTLWRDLTWFANRRLLRKSGNRR
jgi:glycosyltransferase involved in cell wall biosynthesis